jgi:hypothetical protein
LIFKAVELALVDVDATRKSLVRKKVKCANHSNKKLWSRLSDTGALLSLLNSLLDDTSRALYRNIQASHLASDLAKYLLKEPIQKTTKKVAKKKMPCGYGNRRSSQSRESMKHIYGEKHLKR